MSTRCTTHFVCGASNDPEAIIYRHSDGYPEGHGVDLSKFFDAVEAQTADTRFSDPSYLAAKLVVWLADKFASKYDSETQSYVKSQPLDFLSVGIVQKDPGDIEYRYVVRCGTGARPEVECWAIQWDDSPAKLEPIPDAVTS